MNAKCYYCNKQLTERTIKRHMKNCDDMKLEIDKELQENNKKRKQYIISIKDKYSKKYCIYLSIDASLQLCHLDQFIRDVWVECCGHLSEFTINGDRYHDNRDGNYEMNVKLKDILYTGLEFDYIYDFGSSTYLTLEVVDEITVSKIHSQIEIIARNNESKKLNSPRDGECGYVCDEEAENMYLPGNKMKYKVSNKKPNFNEDNYYNDYDNFDDVLGNMDRDELNQLLSDFHNEMNDEINKTLDYYFNGVYSFDIEEIIKSLKKDDMIRLANDLSLSIPRKLKKKEFAEELINQYEEAAEAVITKFTKDRYKLLSEGMKNKGIIVSKDDRLEFEFSVFRSGVIFPSNDRGLCIFIIPTVVQNILNKNNTITFRKKIKENTEIVKIISGMIYAYGVVKCSDIENTLNEMGYCFDDFDDVLSMFAENKIFDCSYYEVDDLNGKPKYLVNDDIKSYESILQLTDENLPIKKFSKDKLMQMGKDEYLLHSILGKQFKNDLLSFFVMLEEDAEDDVDMMALDVQYRSPDDIIEDVINGINVEIGSDDKRSVRNAFNNFLKNIPIWSLKGFTINEIEKQEAKNKVTHNNDNKKVIELFPNSKRK